MKLISLIHDFPICVMLFDIAMRVYCYSTPHGIRLVTKIYESNKMLEDPNLNEYLKGEESSAAWKGSTEILKRKKQVPLSEYSPQTVVTKCLEALQCNDDPQLDHGCCVLLSFKSPTGLLSQGGLDPAGYGRFLRSTNYDILIDNSKFDLIGEPVTLQDSLSIRQRVQVTAWGNALTRLFDFYLSKFNDMWLVDVVLACEG
jgi:hypothetical protein